MDDQCVKIYRKTQEMMRSLPISTRPNLRAMPRGCLRPDEADAAASRHYDTQVYMCSTKQIQTEI